MLALAVFVLAGCGSSVAIIPKGTPPPKPQVTQIAPGVSVPVSALSVPPYTVSATNPLPTGVSAHKVVADIQVDNLIENAAIVRQDPTLLPYADAGAWLTAEQGEISQNITNKVKVLSITDNIQSIQVGFRPDPNNALATAAVITAGEETQTQRSTTGRTTTKVTKFDVIQWLLWAQNLDRYILCDTASS